MKEKPAPQKELPVLNCKIKTRNMMRKRKNGIKQLLQLFWHNLNVVLCKGDLDLDFPLNYMRLDVCRICTIRLQPHTWRMRGKTGRRLMAGLWESGGRFSWCDGCMCRRVCDREVGGRSGGLLLLVEGKGRWFLCLHEADELKNWKFGCE